MIGDQLKRTPPPPRYIDPEEPLAGRCMTCKSVVSCLRRDVKIGNDKAEVGVWNDLPCVECPECGARVFVMSAVEFQRLTSEKPG